MRLLVNYGKEKYCLKGDSQACHHGLHPLPRDQSQGNNPAPIRTGRKEIIDFYSAMEPSQAVAIATEEGENVIIDSETIDGSMYHARHMQMSL